MVLRLLRRRLLFCVGLLLLIARKSTPATLDEHGQRMEKLLYDNNHNNNQSLVSEGTYMLNKTLIGELRRAVRSEKRDKQLRQTLQSAAGVYRNKSRASQIKGLDRTVLITVLEYDKAGLMHYKVHLMNFLCYTSQYNYDVILFILHHHISDLQKEIEILESYGVFVMTYSDEMFWRVLATKSTRIVRRSKEHSSYHGHVPSFAGYGALVMLVPALEIVEQGYNVIYFDLDIGLVVDPIPHLMKGDADFVMSNEVRNCEEVWPSLVGHKYQWFNVEPNTGTMLIRSTEQSRRLFWMWLTAMVDQNLVNDQRALQWKAYDTQYTGNCNWDGGTQTTRRRSSNTTTYCVLSEILFQNGNVAFHCSTKKHYTDDWYTAMWLVGAAVNKTRRFPITVHANYCNLKSHELRLRGLWLLNDTVFNNEGGRRGMAGRYAGAAGSSKERQSAAFSEHYCSVYDFEKTWYNTHDWQGTYQRIQDYRSIAYNDSLQEGNYIMRRTAREVFLVGANRTLRAVPDSETFGDLNVSWSSVKTVPAQLLFDFAVGVPLPSTSKDPKTVKQHVKDKVERQQVYSVIQYLPDGRKKYLRLDIDGKEIIRMD